MEPDGCAVAHPEGVEPQREKKEMTKTYLFAIFFSLFLAQLCLAEMYQYTDNEGVVHFTDNPQKVPVKLLEKSKKEIPSSLSTNKSYLTEHKPQKNRDDFAHGYQEKYGDPEQTKYDDPKETRDSRLSTPEGALDLFLSALRIGNLIDCKASVTGWFWHWYSASSEQAIKKDLLQMEKNISGRIIAKSEQNEHRAVFQTKRNNSPIVGTIELINRFGNWKVNRLY